MEHHYIIFTGNEPQHLPALLQRVIVFLDRQRARTLLRSRSCQALRPRAQAGKILATAFTDRACESAASLTAEDTRVMAMPGQLHEYHGGSRWRTVGRAPSIFPAFATRAVAAAVSSNAARHFADRMAAAPLHGQPHLETLDNTDSRHVTASLGGCRLVLNIASFPELMLPITLPARFRRRGAAR